jgi:hypothetical protein
MTARATRRKNRADLAGERDLRGDGIVRGRTLGRAEDEQQAGGDYEGAAACVLPSTFCLVRYRWPPLGLVSVIGFGGVTGLKSIPVYCISSQV